jgi:hypothetical protein
MKAWDVCISLSHREIGKFTVAECKTSSFAVVLCVENNFWYDAPAGGCGWMRCPRKSIDSAIDLANSAADAERQGRGRNARASAWQRLRCNSFDMAVRQFSKESAG